MASSTPFPMIRAGSLCPFILELQRRDKATQAPLKESWAPLHPEDYPEAPLPEICLWNFIENCGRASNDGDFGYSVAQRFGLAGGGALTSRLLAGKNLQAALNTFLNAITEHSSESQPRLFYQGDSVWLRRGALPDKGRGFWQVEQYAVGTLLAVIRAYAGPRWKPRTIRVRAQTSLTRGSALENACTVLESGADFAEIEIPQRLLARPLRGKPATKKKAPRKFPTSFTDALSQVLSSYVGDYTITLELAAGILGLHPRTVKRRLAAESATFRSIREYLLADYAQRRLLDSGACVAEISAELGYAHTPHFCRAFKRQTGMSPGEYRAGKGARSNA